MRLSSGVVNLIDSTALMRNGSMMAFMARHAVGDDEHRTVMEGAEEGDWDHRLQASVAHAVIVTLRSVLI
jgi:hypothetical protein